MMAAKCEIRRTNGCKLERVFCQAEVIAGIVRGSTGRIARESEGVDRFILAGSESSASMRG